MILWPKHPHKFNLLPAQISNNRCDARRSFAGDIIYSKMKIEKDKQK